MNRHINNAKRAGHPARFAFSARVGAANGNLFFWFDVPRNGEFSLSSA